MCNESFSVLLSLYDKENPTFLNECLQSLQDQTLHSEQIVIIFDGYINPSLEAVVNSFQSKLPIEIIKLKKNVGLGMALNEGLKHCKFDLVARMDTDDVCMRNRFEKQINYMHNNPKVAITGSAIDEYDETLKNCLFTRKTKSQHLDIMNYAKYRSPFNHMTVVFRKSVVLKAGGYLHHLFMEDYNLWLRILAIGSISYNFDESLVIARTGISMIKRRKGKQYIKSELKLARLKYQLSFNGMFSSIIIFLLRVSPRLLPSTALLKIYKILRNN
ncbi:glycosyltransferase [Providencia rettgeri]